MSHTTVKALWPGERAAGLMLFGNSWGSAPYVWDALARRWLGVERGLFLLHQERLWGLWRDKTVPTHQRAVLGLTFDRAYVSRADYSRMAQAIRRFLEDFPPESGHANHWRAIAGLLEADSDVPAIGLHVTSITDDPFAGPWNEEREEHEPFDWSTAFDVFLELDAMGA